MTCENPGCNAVLDPERVAQHGAKTCNASCRAAAHRARWGIRPVSAGGPVAVAREARLHGPEKPSGIQCSYFKTLNILTAELEQLRRFGFSQMDAAGETERDWARRVLREALPEKQRERLRG
jgi:hypothetical protein